jgi:sporulation protein YlmC with PRC-barrel domain
MKTSLICGVALAILGGAAPLIAQTRTAPPSTEANYVQTSKVIGTKVKTSQGEEIGVVKDVVLERSNGCLAYTVLSTGGGGARVTGQSKLVAVPWSVFVVSPDASYLTVNVERDRIYNAPVFEYSRISDAAYISNVYSHFSVSAGVSNATMPGATTATTGSTTQTQGGAPVSPTASPGASASVSPGAFAFPSVSASAAPSATASPSASADAKASASPKSRNKGRGESQTSSRHKGEETTQGAGGESTSEATGSSSGNKSSARKSTSEESSAESENTPSSKKSSHKKSGNEGTSETAPTPGGEQE